MRFVWGRRLDGLNLSESSLYKANAEDWAIVSMDRLEQAFVQSLLAPLAKGAPLAPDESVPVTSVRAEVSRTASRIVSAEIVAATKLSKGDAESLHKAIAQRNEIAGSLSKTGYRIPATSGIELSASTVRRVTRWKEESPRDRPLLEDFLRMNERAVSYRRDVAPVVAVLTRLEEELFAGAIIEQKLGRDAHERAIVASSLGMLARAQECPRLAFWRIVRPIFDTEGADVGAASATAHALLRRLGLAPANDAAENDESDAFMRGIIAILELPPAQVRAAAAAAYAELVGGEPPPFTRKTLE
jgi:hypothetical protein